MVAIWQQIRPRGAAARRFTYDTRPLSTAAQPFMQLLFDFLPVLAFFVAYKVGGIYIATATIMVAMVVMCVASWVRTRKVSNMMLISTGLAVALGGATLIMHDSSFIKLKMTIVDWLFALGFLLAPRFLNGKTVVEKMMAEQITLTDNHWRQLNWMWVGFFAFIGAINLYVLHYFSEATWNNFKLGSIGLTLVFVVIQGLWLSGKISTEPPKADNDHTPPTDHHN